MTVIAEKDRPTIRELLARELSEDVELLLFTRGRSSESVAGDEDALTCDETRELLADLTGLSDQLHLTTIDLGTNPDAFSRFNVAAVPTVIIRRRDFVTGSPDTATDDRSHLGTVPSLGARSGPGAASERDANVRFLGLPGGYEFSTLLADVLDVSKGRVDLSSETSAAIAAIETPVHIQVFVTPT